MSTTAVTGASLLDRLGVAPSARNGRARDGRHSPYARPPKASADDDGPWKHDMYASQNKIEGGTLGARLAVKERPAPSTMESLSLKKALAAVNGSSKSDPLNIRGASGVTIEVRELVKGTTAADVEAIFKRCGTITQSRLITPRGADVESVQIKYKSQAEAEKAIAAFHGQPADGRILQVVMVNGGISLRNEGATGVVTVDGLLDDDDSFGGSKMRSDAIMASDSRAQVLTDPLGVATSTQAARVAEGRGRRGGRRGRGSRRGRGQGGGMDID